MTAAETIAWGFLKNNSIKGARFRRQYSIKGFVIDFFCPRLKLAVEIDGPCHLSKKQTDYDNARQSLLEQLNIKFLRFRNEDVISDPASVISSIENEIHKD